MSEDSHPEQAILSEERSEEIGVALRSILLLLDSITEEELQAICLEAERDNAFGPFLNPTAYQSGGRFQVNKQMKVVASGLLELKRRVK